MSARFVTLVQGQEAPWDEEIAAKWAAVVASDGFPEGRVTRVNYFRPRPYRNEYDRGSKDEGFTYTVGRWGAQRVFQTIINKEDRA